MDELKQVIFKDINNTIMRLKLNHSISLYPYLLSDLNELYDLCNALGIEGYPVYEDTKVFTTSQKYNVNIVNKINEIYFQNYALFESLIRSVNRFYKDYPTYKEYDYFPKIKMDINEIVLLVSDFLKKFDMRYYNLFKDLSNKRKLIISPIPSRNAAGITYNGYTFSPYIVFENTNNLLTATTIVHEIAHAFSNNLISNIELKKQNNRYLNNSVEICSYTIELFFIDYLKKIHFYENDIQRLINDYNSLLKRSAKYCEENLYIVSKTIDLKEEDGEDNDFNNGFANLCGKCLAVYLFSLKDKDKALDLIDKISIESCEKSLTDIILDNNMDYNDISKFKSGRKLFKKWN